MKQSVPLSAHRPSPTWPSSETPLRETSETYEIISTFSPIERLEHPGLTCYARCSIRKSRLQMPMTGGEFGQHLEDHTHLPTSDGARSAPIGLLPKRPLHSLHRRWDHLTDAAPHPERYSCIVGRFTSVHEYHSGTGPNRPPNQRGRWLDHERGA